MRGGGAVIVARAAGAHPGLGPARRADRHLSRRARRARARRHARARAPAGGDAVGHAAVRPRRRAARRRHGGALDARRVVGLARARGRRVPHADLKRPGPLSCEQPMPTGCSQRPPVPGPSCGHGLRHRRAASRAPRRPRPASAPRAAGRRAHDDPRRRVRHRAHRAARRAAARHGAARAVVRRARRRRGDRRRLLRAAGRHAARRGPHARRRRAGTSRSPRRGRPCARACTCRAASTASRRATSCPRRRAATCCRPGRCSSAAARRSSAARTDREGFSAGEAQFDSDITDGRYPRAALGLAPGRMFAVACDGRSRHDAGLTLEELAALMAALGCETALNLDGGGSTSLVSGRAVAQPAAWGLGDA